MIETLKRQYQGFLDTPQLIINKEILGADFFETKEKVEILSIKDSIEALSKNKYLGKRAELFFLAYLRASTRFTDIIHSFQINSEEKTLGEVDFICFDQLKQRWIHIELVYKLYVFTGENQFDDLTFWIGPNLKDRLDYKINKLKSHQIPLGEHPDVLNSIKSDDIKSYCCFKAKLFLKNKVTTLKPTNINANCVSGIYMNFEEFKSFRYKKSIYHVPDKPDWTCKPETNKHWYNFEEAEERLKPKLKDKRARLVWEKTEAGEYFEYFVVWW